MLAFATHAGSAGGNCAWDFLDKKVGSCYAHISNRKGGEDMKLGENLQYLRRMNGNITQEKLAEQMKVSRQTISKWETGVSHS